MNNHLILPNNKLNNRREISRRIELMYSQNNRPILAVVISQNAIKKSEITLISIIICLKVCDFLICSCYIIIRSQFIVNEQDFHFVFVRIPTRCLPCSQSCRYLLKVYRVLSDLKSILCFTFQFCILILRKVLFSLLP